MRSMADDGNPADADQETRNPGKAVTSSWNSVLLGTTYRLAPYRITGIYPGSIACDRVAMKRPATLTWAAAARPQGNRSSSSAVVKVNGADSGRGWPGE